MVGRMRASDADERASVRLGAGVPRSPVELDAVDKQIVAILQADGRRSYAAIAKQVGVSEGTARSRVQRLMESELLQVVGIADLAPSGVRDDGDDRHPHGARPRERRLPCAR